MINITRQMTSLLMVSILYASCQYHVCVVQMHPAMHGEASVMRAPVRGAVPRGRRRGAHAVPERGAVPPPRARHLSLLAETCRADLRRQRQGLCQVSMIIIR